MSVEQFNISTSFAMTQTPDGQFYIEIAFTTGPTRFAIICPESNVVDFAEGFLRNVKETHREIVKIKNGLVTPPSGLIVPGRS